MEIDIVSWITQLVAIIAFLALLALAIRWGFRWWRGRKLSKCSGEKIAILVAEIVDVSSGPLAALAQGKEGIIKYLTGQEMNNATQEIDNALHNELDAILGGVEIHMVRRRLSVKKFGDRAKNWVAAINKGRQWLEETNADLLIWGEASTADTGKIRLNYLGSHGSPEGRFTEFDTGETFDASFGEGMSVALAAQVLAQLSPVLERLTIEPAKILIPFAEKIETLLNNPPISLAGEALSQSQSAYANLASEIGEQAQDSIWLQKSLVAYNLVLEGIQKESNPSLWAMTQNNLGNALQQLGKRLEGHEGIDKLKAAVVANESALEVCTREALPLDWAMTQNNLGTALAALGARLEGQEGIEHLETAVAAFEAALEVYTKDSFPRQHANVLDNLKIVKTVLEERQL